MPHVHIPDQKLGRARRLRRAMTDAESILWFELRAHRLTDLHFRRQVPIGSYIADFVSHEAKVIIELDGEQHAFDPHAARDASRDAWFASQGYLTLRIWNHEVLRELDSVTDTIFARCSERLPKSHSINLPPSLTLPHKGGGDAAAALQEDVTVGRKRKPRT